MEDNSVTFSAIALKKLVIMLDQGFKPDGLVFLVRGDEKGVIDNFGRVTWLNQCFNNEPSFDID